MKNKLQFFLFCGFMLYAAINVLQNIKFHTNYLRPWFSSHFQPQHKSLFRKNSLSILMEEVQKLDRKIPDDAIDISNKSEAVEFCDQFKHFKYGGRTEKRRIFAGSLLADDSWHALGANALETYGMYHSIIFIESNRTQSLEPRPWRFYEGSNDLRILQSGIFGPNTPVYVEQFDLKSDVSGLVREHTMRKQILYQWKKLGMTTKDVGLIFDVDEIPTRDMLLAAQICDTENNYWDTVDNKCKNPLVRINLSFFEGSPKCIHTLPYSKTAMVIGACIEGIGDAVHSTRYPPVQRKSRTGTRLSGYGYANFDSIPNGLNGYFPLYNAADFRSIYGLMTFKRKEVYRGMRGGAGFHLHNFFVSTDKLRFKHAFYGHIHQHAYSSPLGAMNADLNVMAKCVHNISDDGDRKHRLKNGLTTFQKYFQIPESFKLDGYIDLRHEEIKTLIEKDEQEYGRADNFDAHHLYNETKHLTHPGRQHTNIIRDMRG